ncbi:hypothetical protein [Ureibacillus sp. GCM10028918]|uniref:hypothetical protein n=1 Tax=Ureibacillus sp. GCM10028918 TaxID=3273429 RepID=UPI00360A0DBF
MVALSFLTGSIFRKQLAESHISSCLAMFVAMTKSLLVGIVVAIWIPDMVLSTIISMILSFAFVVIMVYKLSSRVFIESLGALFMGAMMGAMFSLMTTNYELLGITFFTVIYILSCVMAIGLWNKEEYPNFIRAIPLKVLTTAALALFLLGASLVADAIFVSDEVDPETEEIHQHHH